MEVLEMKSPTKILTINNGGKCEKIQLFPKLTDEFQITEIKFESLNRRTITKEKEVFKCEPFWNEYPWILFGSDNFE